MIDMAPMEGLTTATFRCVFLRHYRGIDRLYTPFLSLNQTHTFKMREKKEFMPFSTNGICGMTSGLPLIPQVLTASTEDYLWAARIFKEYGFPMINLNIGCPSGTVVAKGKGAGMLSDPEKLARFLDTVLNESEKEDLPSLSVKTRLGMSSFDEVQPLAKLLASFPLAEAVVHPRFREDYYKNKPNLEGFSILYETLRSAGIPVIYNGDLFSADNYEAFREAFPDVSHIMLGRGLLRNPELAEEIKAFRNPDSARLAHFLNDLLPAYREELSGDRDVLFKMKDLWAHLGLSFPDQKKELKAINKSRTIAEYQAAVRELLSSRF